MTYKEYILMAWFFILGWTFGRMWLKEKLESEYKKKLEDEERRAGENFNIGFEIASTNYTNKLKELLDDKKVPADYQLQFFNALKSKLTK